MENTLCIVSAQYFDENGKPKGEQKFTLRVDSEVFWYAPETLVRDAIQSIIQENYPYAGRVEYRSHELVFIEPINCKQSFGKRMQSLHDKRTTFTIDAEKVILRRGEELS